MTKNYVIDTNVFLSDPTALFAFGDNNVIIPSVVLEEIDSKKKLQDELGRNARYFARILDDLRLKGTLHNGVELPQGGTLIVAFHNLNSRIFEKFLDNKNDNAIIDVAFSWSHPHQEETILVSKDTLVRVKAETLGIKAEDYLNDKTVQNEDDLYSGYTEVYKEQDFIDHFFSDKQIYLHEQVFLSAPDNHVFILKACENPSCSAVTIKKQDKLVPFYNYTKDTDVWGIKHKNVGQMIALEHLLNDNISIVSLTGKAGTGKTILALAAALMKNQDQKKYSKVLVGRPIVPMGKDIGYLPGEKDEKLRPWMQPIYDNLEYLFNTKKPGDIEKILAGMQEPFQIEALTYIRGRSIPNQFIIIDEAQNLTKHEIKTIATRLGEGSKLVLLGDPHQIDHPYLDMYSNGLTYLIETLKDQNAVAHVTLTEGERSGIAQICADLL